MRYAVLLLVPFLSCTSTVDKAGDRLDVTVDAAASRFTEAGKELIKASGDEARKTIDHAAAVLETKVAVVMEGVASRATAMVSAPVEKTVEKVIDKLPEEDKEGFIRTRRTRGLWSAIAEYWVEIIAALTGTSGWGGIKWWLAQRRAKRAETLAKTVVQAVEEKGAKAVKEATREKIRGTKDEDAIESLIRKFQKT